jgi:hypothetical protein
VQLTRREFIAGAAALACGPLPEDEEYSFVSGRYREEVFSQPLPTTDVVPVIIWGGSNAIGNGAEAQSGIPIEIPWQKFISGSAVPQVQFRPREFGQLTQMAVCGTDIQIAKDLIAAGKNPVIITCGMGNTNLTDWVPASSAPQWPTIRDYVFPSICRLPKTIKRFFVNIEGTTDGQSGTNAPLYQGRAITLISQFRAGVGGSMHLLMSRTNAATTAGVTFLSTIRAAQEYVAANDSDGELVDEDGIPLVNDPHYDTAGYNTLGSRIAAQILANL